MKLWREIAKGGGFSLDDTQIGLLEVYRDWLKSEAIPAGGMGPAEETRLDERHIGDSLLFAWPFAASPESVADLGSGVGLPGIPLAILWPQSRVHLIERSRKRHDLARRACRILGLDNAETHLGDLTNLGQRYPAIVSRAAMPPENLAKHVRKLLHPGGLAVVGGSWAYEPHEPAWETRQILTEMLDRTVWLLIMRRQ